MRYLKIPKDRVGVLIGHNGETKQRIEELSQIILTIDSEDGEVVLDDRNASHPLMGLQTEEVIRAIGRGFSPDHAFRLFQDDSDFFVFNIHDYVGKKDHHVRRLKSRVIGKNGKTKRVLEQLTGADISVYGHTIAVIAEGVYMDIVKRAIDMFLSGSEHHTVYRFIEREMKKLKRGSFF